MNLIDWMLLIPEPLDDKIDATPHHDDGTGFIQELPFFEPPCPGQPAHGKERRNGAHTKGFVSYETASANLLFIKNLFLFTKAYSGADPQLVEDDIFRIIIPLTEQVTEQVTEQETEQETEQVMKRLRRIIGDKPVISDQEFTAVFGHLSCGQVQSKPAHDGQYLAFPRTRHEDLFLYECCDAHAGLPAARVFTTVQNILKLWE